MKNFYLSLIFTVISFSAFAQDTIYMDNNYQELDTKEGAKYFKIVIPTPDKDYEFLRTTYFADGTKKAKQSYDLKDEKKVYEGVHKHFYESGELFHSVEFKKGKIQKRIKKYKDRIDEHHIMVFYYKIASLYFGDGNNKKCIEYLNKIINNKSLEMREDLMCFARILSLVAHYEAGLDYHLDRLVKSTYKFLIKMNDLHEVQKEMIRFLRNLPEVSPLEIKDEFKKLHSKLKEFEDHPYERRAFLYLDIISWLESKIQNRPVADVIAEKAALVSR